MDSFSSSNIFKIAALKSLCVQSHLKSVIIAHFVSIWDTLYGVFILFSHFLALLQTGHFKQCITATLDFSPTHTLHPASLPSLLCCLCHKCVVTWLDLLREMYLHSHVSCGVLSSCATLGMLTIFLTTSSSGFPHLPAKLWSGLP